MGHKVNPVGFRVGIKRDWNTHWYAEKGDFSKFLLEDIEARKFLEKTFKNINKQVKEKNKNSRDLGVLYSHTVIDRKKNNEGKLEVSVKPYIVGVGIMLGNEGKYKKEVVEGINKIFKEGSIRVEFVEIKNPYLDAKIVAQIIARQLENRGSFRNVQKKAIMDVRKAGAKGCRTLVGGRLGGADIARNEGYKDGIIPLHTLKSDIDFATCEAATTYGRLGVKVWICRGDYKSKEELEKEAQENQMNVELNRRPNPRFRRPREGGNE